MNIAGILAAALLVLPAIGLALWACLVMRQVEDELGDGCGFEAMPVED
ncbi:MAG: hypothetical protein Q7T97_17790 [Burkholderiaceae bacterium]|nr:hypothetical protein [Burkholderiaceae bacterium]